MGRIYKPGLLLNQSQLVSQLGEGNGTPPQYSWLENRWTEEPGRLQSMGSLRVRHFTFHVHVLEKEMATRSSILAWRIPGMEEPGGMPSMGHTESDTTEATQQQQRQHWVKGCFYRKVLHSGWTWVSLLDCTLMNLYKQSLISSISQGLHAHLSPSDFLLFLQHQKVT